MSKQWSTRRAKPARSHRGGFWVLALALLIPLLPTAPAGAQSPTNYNRNPSFEGDYYPWGGIPEIQVAQEWTPWWVPQQPSDPPEINRRPEYKRADAALYPNRVHSGAAAQQWFTFYSTHIAGMYQQVSNLPPGSRLQFSIWAQAWSSSQDDPYQSIDPGEINLQIGLDPTGNTDPWAGSVVWTGAYNIYDAWFQISVEAVAQNSTVTVFLKSAPRYPVKHNDTYWDDAALVVMGSEPPPASPTPTVATEPTSTGTPATEPTVTETAATPEPTLTPAPTPTCAPAPAHWVPYTVVRGDYLIALARAFNTTLEEIIAYNCLSQTTIYPGQQLLLPPPTATKTPAPPTATPAATATREPPPTPTPAATETPAASPTPMVVAAATLTSPPVPPTQAPTATGEAAAPAPTDTPEPDSEGGLGGLCGSALFPGVILVGAAVAGRRQRRGQP